MNSDFDRSIAGQLWYMLYIWKTTKSNSYPLRVLFCVWYITTIQRAVLFVLKCRACNKCIDMNMTLIWIQSLAMFVNNEFDNENTKLPVWVGFLTERKAMSINVGFLFIYFSGQICFSLYAKRELMTIFSNDVLPEEYP